MTHERGSIGLLRRWLLGHPGGPAPDSTPGPDDPRPGDGPDGAGSPMNEDEPEVFPGEIPASEAPWVEPPSTPGAGTAGDPLPAIVDRPAILSVHAIWTPKRGDADAECEDAFAYDEQRGCAAVADGASEGIFSRAWASLLSTVVVGDAPKLDDPEAVAGWLGALRATWFREIDYPSRRYTQQMKVDQTGAAATLLVLRVTQRSAEDPEGTDHPEDENEPYGWHAWAVGDSCLFQVRDESLIATFPIAASGDFGLAPALLRTRAGTPIPAFQSFTGGCRPGDLFLLATDAVAQSFLRAVEAGDPPDWNSFERLDRDAWRAVIDDLRDRRAIVNDDAMLLCARLLPASGPS